MQEVRIDAKSVDAFADLVGEPAVEALRAVATRLRENMGDRIIWNVNSTAAGGGVAEMLHTLLPYARGLEVDARWLVIDGNTEFFAITKRIHNALHGEVGSGAALDAAATMVYDEVTKANAAALDQEIRPGDIAILHDPQTAGLIPHMVRRGVGVVWRCHIGNDLPSVEGDRAWGFLEPYLTKAHAFIFSRFAYLPDFLYHGRCLVTPPAIDPFSAKNQEMDGATVQAILGHIGVIDGVQDTGPRQFIRKDGSTATIERRADIERMGSAPKVDDPIVLQVSRWDRLKDPVGVLRGFARSLTLPQADTAHLVLAGPDVKAVADDPEGAEVFAEVVNEWRSMPEEQQHRVHLVNLPMDDLEENAAMVNALQRHATVVIQKSLREGFGLTVTEAMWKARPVIASAVGGIQDQIEHGVSGLLLRNPQDIDSFAGAVNQVLGNPAFAERLARNGRNRVIQNYLGLSLVAEYDDLVERLAKDTEGVTT